MANNTVSLIIDLENNTKKGFNDLQKQIKKLEKENKKANKSLKATDKELKKVSKSSKTAAKNVNQLNKATAGVASGLKSIAAVGAAVSAALALIAKNALDSNKELTALSNIAGINQAEFQKLAIGYESFGVSADDLASSIKDLNERLNDANTNNAGEFVDIAKSLGLNLKELGKLEPDELLKRMNTELSKLSEKDRISFADRLGSDAFIKVSQAAAKSGEEIDALVLKAKELDIGLKDVDAKALSKISQEFSLLGGNVDTLTKETLASFEGTLVSLLKNINQQITNLRNSEQAEGTGQISNAFEGTYGLIKNGLEQISMLSDSFIGSMVQGYSQLTGNQTVYNESLIHNQKIAQDILDINTKTKIEMFRLGAALTGAFYDDKQIQNFQQILDLIEQEVVDVKKVNELRKNIPKQFQESARFQLLINEAVARQIVSTEKEKKIQEEKTKELEKQGKIIEKTSKTKIDADLTFDGKAVPKITEKLKNIEVKAKITELELEGDFSGAIDKKFNLSIKETLDALIDLKQESQKVLDQKELFSDEKIKKAQEYSDAIDLQTAALIRNRDAAQLEGLKQEGQRLQTGLNAGVEGFTQENVDANQLAQLEAQKKLTGETSLAYLQLLEAQKQAQLQGLKQEGLRLQTGLNAGVEGFTQENVDANQLAQLEAQKKLTGETSLAYLQLLESQKQVKEGLLLEDIDEKDQLFGLGRLTDEAYMAILQENLEKIKAQFGEDGIEFAQAEEKIAQMTKNLEVFGLVSEEIAKDFAAGFGKAFTDVLINGESFGDSMKKLLADLAMQFIQAAIQAFILSVIMKSMGFGGTGVGGDTSGDSISSLFKTNFGAAFGVPTRHNGGEVGSSGDSGNSTKNINPFNPNSSLLPNERLIVAQTDESVIKTNSLQSPTGVGSSEVMQPQVNVTNFVTDDVMTTFLESEGATDSIINIINNNQDKLIG